MDVNSARTGTYAFCDSGGGLFTTHLCLAIRSASDAPQGTIVTWRDFLSKVDDAVKKDAARRLKSPWDVADSRALVLSKTGTAVSLQVQEAEIFGRLATPSRTRMPLSGQPLGIVVEKAGQDGVKLTRVIEDSPAAWAGLRSGDLLVDINHITMRTPEELAAAITTLSKANTFSLPILLKVTRTGNPSPIEIKLWLEEDREMALGKELNGRRRSLMSALQNGRYDEAEQIGRELVAKSRDSAEDHYNFAAALAGDKKADEALARLRRSIDLGAIEEYWKIKHVNLVAQMVGSKHFSSMKTDPRLPALVDMSWSRLLACVGPDRDSLAALALNAQKAGDSKKAFDILERAIGQGLNTDAFIFKDPAWASLKADARFEELQRQASHQTVLLKELQAAMGKRDLHEADRIGRGLVAASPMNPEYHCLLAGVLVGEEKADDALEHLQKSIALGLLENHWKTGRRNIVAQFAAINASIKSDHRFAAILAASWERLLVKAGSDRIALANLALDALKTGESTTALDILERAISQGVDADAFVFKDPAWEQLRSDLRFQQLERKAAEASCDAAAKAALLNPTSYAFYQWAKSLARLKKSDEAMQKIEQAVNLGLDPDMLLLKDDVLQSLKSDPRLPKLQRQAAETSCEAAAKAAAADPKSAFALYNWARCLARLNKADEALQKLQQSVELGRTPNLDAMSKDPAWASVIKDRRLLPVLERAKNGAHRGAPQR